MATNYGVGGSNPSLPELFADVAELVDARDLGSRVFGVSVRVSPSVIYFNVNSLNQNKLNFYTGVAGFEPTNGGVKVHSLTTWRHPKKVTQFTIIKVLFLGKKGFEPLTP